MASIQNPTGFNLARVVKDVRDLHCPEGGIYAKVKNDDYGMIYVMLIGAEDTPYEGGVFYFTVEPGRDWAHNAGSNLKYPFNSPRVLFYSGYKSHIHTNLYTPEMGGKVCLSILYGTTDSNEKWIPTMSFNTIFQTIFGILDLATSESFYEGCKMHARPWDMKCTITRDTITEMIIPSLEGKSKANAIQWPDTQPINFGELFRDEIREMFTRRYGKYCLQVKKLSNWIKAQAMKGKKTAREYDIYDMSGGTRKIDCEALTKLLEQHKPAGYVEPVAPAAATPTAATYTPTPVATFYTNPKAPVEVKITAKPKAEAVVVTAPPAAAPAPAVPKAKKKSKELKVSASVPTVTSVAAADKLAKPITAAVLNEKHSAVKTEITDGVIDADDFLDGDIDD